MYLSNFYKLGFKTLKQRKLHFKKWVEPWTFKTI